MQEEDRKLTARLRRANFQTTSTAAPTLGFGSVSRSMSPNRAVRPEAGAAASLLQVENQRLRAELEAVRQAMHGGAAGNLAATSGLQAEVDRLRADNARLVAAAGGGQQSHVISLGALPSPCIKGLA